MPRFIPRPASPPDGAEGSRRGSRPAPRPAPHPASRPADRPARPPQRWQSGRREPQIAAVIGDELRIPILWCQFGSCIARYTHRAALGERDLRARALVAGWRFDALGRLACPDCVQHDPTFWITYPPAPVR